MNTKQRILVVDDEERIVRMIRLNLEHDGFTVIEANNGMQAINQIREKLPNLVILDVMMPGIDGYETLSLIRETSQVPVIMLTAKSEEEDRIYGLELGADDYITKPFSPRELVSRIKAVPGVTASSAVGTGQGLADQLDPKVRFDEEGHGGVADRKSVV